MMGGANSLLFLLFAILIVFSLMASLNLSLNYARSRFTLQQNVVSASFNNSYVELNDWGEEEKKRFPQAIIIGARKCGTRALLELINIHPMVRVSHRELHFFEKDELFSKGYGWYLDQMPVSFPDQITIEKTPAYFPSQDAPLRIRQMDPHKKIILIVRDPVTRLLSDYVHSKDNRDWQEFEEKILKRKSGKLRENWRLFDIGKYAVHLNMWLHFFPREQILILSGERLIKNPKAEIEKLEEFLGLERLIDEDHFVHDPEKGFTCYKSFDKKTTKCLGESKGRKHPEVDQTVMERLREFYRPFNKKFYDLVKEDFGWDEDIDVQMVNAAR